MFPVTGGKGGVCVSQPPEFSESTAIFKEPEVQDLHSARVIPAQHCAPTGNNQDIGKRQARIPIPTNRFALCLTASIEQNGQ